MNILLIDKSKFQTKYVWQEKSTLANVIDKIIEEALKEYKSLSYAVCYLNHSEYDSLRNSIDKALLMYRGIAPIPKELKPMCGRWFRYNGVYFMEER